MLQLLLKIDKTIIRWQWTDLGQVYLNANLYVCKKYNSKPSSYDKAAAQPHILLSLWCWHYVTLRTTFKCLLSVYSGPEQLPCLCLPVCSGVWTGLWTGAQGQPLSCGFFCNDIAWLPVKRLPSSLSYSHWCLSFEPQNDAIPRTSLHLGPQRRSHRPVNLAARPRPKKTSCPNPSSLLDLSLKK